MSHKQKPSYFPWSCYICNGFCMARIATFRGCCLGWLRTSDVYTAKSLSWTRNRSPRNWQVERSIGPSCVLFAPNSNVTATALNQPMVGQLIVGDVAFYVYHWLQKRRFSYRFPWIVDQHQPSTIPIFHQSSNDVHWLVICKRFSESMLGYALT